MRPSQERITTSVDGAQIENRLCLPSARLSSSQLPEINKPTRVLVCPPGLSSWVFGLIQQNLLSGNDRSYLNQKTLFVGVKDNGYGNKDSSKAWRYQSPPGRAQITTFDILSHGKSVSQLGDTRRIAAETSGPNMCLSDIKPRRHRSHWLRRTGDSSAAPSLPDGLANIGG